MAVYTEVPLDEARAFLGPLNLAPVTALKACAGGIENTNYFVSTESSEWVLTLFERLSFEQLPFYLHLMKHLAQKGIPVPDPQANARGEILHRLLGKPAALVNRLQGGIELQPTSHHCQAVGQMLARMHLAGQDFALYQPNLRGLAWWNETAPVVLPYLDEQQKRLLQSELAYQNHIAASATYAALPRGAIHADLFRDNVMFEGQGSQAVLTGFFDFYFAGVDTFLFDIAVCLNDWCIDLATGQTDSERTRLFLAAYDQIRPLTRTERALLPALLRAGALRFWISRLWDLHLPRAASLLQAHDPRHFERVLRQRVSQSAQCQAHLPQAHSKP
jgi:homoserine kinase type II